MSPKLLLIKILCLIFYFIPIEQKLFPYILLTGIFPQLLHIFFHIINYFQRLFDKSLCFIFLCLLFTVPFLRILLKLYKTLFLIIILIFQRF